MAGRRLFLKRAVSGLGIAWLGYEGVREFGGGKVERGGGLGFRNDAPAVLGRCSRLAKHQEQRDQDVQCLLCPHACVLREGDRGFCRARVMRKGQLHTVAYGNLCSVALDPVEKKPLYHFLPQTQILSVAMGGCNFRCLNCQNWEISQSKPEDVQRQELMPEELVALALQKRAPSIAFTYTEPLVSWEYVHDTAALARDKGIKSVLVTAGFVNEAPLRELARVIDAVTLDVKAFGEPTYGTLSQGSLQPVLRSLEVLREEGVWIEVSFLMVPTYSAEPAEVEAFSRWVVAHLGAETPLHILRFHPSHKLTYLPPTSVNSLAQAKEAALKAGVRHVYVGNAPSLDSGTTLCAGCGKPVVERQGYRVTANRLTGGTCAACGRRLAGVFS